MVTSNQPLADSRNDPPSANEDVAKLRLDLRHLSLAEVEEEAVLEWDRENHVVRKGPQFHEIWPREEAD